MMVTMLASTATNMRLAIVIPTLNEENRLAALLPEVIPLAEDVWVCDGGSDDGTVEVAWRFGVQVVTGPAGRGRQLELGARAASVAGAEILLFLHADSRLPKEAPRLIRQAAKGGAVGGGFHVHYDHRSWFLRLGNALIRLRTQLTRCPLGDQAQFVTRAAFEASGGFREWPILEDLDFIRRLKRHGRIVIFDPPVVTSARRVLSQGLLRSIATNWLIWALYLLGVSPQRLSRLYLNIR